MSKIKNIISDLPSRKKFEKKSSWVGIFKCPYFSVFFFEILEFFVKLHFRELFFMQNFELWSQRKMGQDNKYL